jgi:hypothetical protein
VLDTGRANVRARAFETVTRWNALEQQVVAVLEHRRRLPRHQVGVDDPAVSRVLLDRWSKLLPGDRRNLGFDEAADLLGLSPAQRRRLKRAGATDLRSIARALKAAPTFERHDADARRVGKLLEDREGAPDPPEPLSFALSTRDVADLEKAIRAGLEQKTAGETAEE